MTTVFTNPEPSLPRFMFGGEWVRPLVDGYAPGYVSNGVSTDIAGGPIRVRQVYANGAIDIECTYDFDADAHRWFRDFYAGKLFNGNKRFVGLFPVTGYELAEGDLYVARFVPGSVTPQSYEGFRFLVSARVNLVPIYNRELSIARADWMAAFGSNSGTAYGNLLQVTKPLERLI